MSNSSNSPLTTHPMGQQHPVSEAKKDSIGGDLGRPGRWGLWALGLGLGGFLLWAALAPLDQGVPAPGQVALDTKRKTVQHLSGGLVEQVLVREGEQVTEGQLLLKLDAAAAKASYESVRQSYLGLLAMQGRLLAEQAEKPRITWSKELKEAAADPLIKAQMLNQERLFETRRQLLRANLLTIEEGVQGQQGMLSSYANMLANRKNQLRLLQEELQQLRGLVAEGYAPRNRQLELERAEADLLSSIADLEGNTLRGQSSIAEFRSRAVSTKQEFRSEVENSLSDVSRQVLVDGEKYRAVSDELGRTEIRSPAAGQVVGLAVQTVGGVVQPGQKLMDIVPKDAPLLLEANVQPHLIDRVQEGMPVDVRFSSFSNSPQLVVQGVVQSISGDLLTEQQTGVQYYLARVEVTGEGLQVLGKRQMLPGMPVEVIFKGGERTMLTYLLHPLTKRIAASLTEE
ncbi:MAG: HlyD family type I secretion periplasmic adaptor subunit [Comamonas sp.]|nr:HlyD family type I secretion periplasmic adaptor subunit [Candidatus Comamonas equi]